MRKKNSQPEETIEKVMEPVSDSEAIVTPNPEKQRHLSGDKHPGHHHAVREEYPQERPVFEDLHNLGVQMDSVHDEMHHPHHEPQVHNMESPIEYCRNVSMKKYFLLLIIFALHLGVTYVISGIGAPLDLTTIIPSGIVLACVFLFCLIAKLSHNYVLAAVPFGVDLVFRLYNILISMFQGGNYDDNALRVLILYLISVFSGVILLGLLSGFFNFRKFAVLLFMLFTLGLNGKTIYDKVLVFDKANAVNEALLITQIVLYSLGFILIAVFYSLSKKDKKMNRMAARRKRRMKEMRR